MIELISISYNVNNGVYMVNAVRFYKNENSYVIQKGIPPRGVSWKQGKPWLNSLILLFEKNMKINTF